MNSRNVKIRKAKEMEGFKKVDEKLLKKQLLAIEI